MRRGLIVLALVSSSAANAATAAGRRALTPEDVLAVPNLTDPRLSPAGDRVAYVATRLGPPRKRTTEVWLVPTAGGEPQRVPLDQARSPRWAPDGRTLALLGPSGGEAAIHLLNVADRSARPLPGTAGARDLAFSPDGRRLAFLREDPPPADLAPRAERGEDARVVDEDPARHVRLWLMDLPSGKARLVLQEDATVWRFGWSPDGNRLALLASKSPLAEGLEYGSRLLGVDLETGQTAVLADRTCPQAAPAFSPDGRWVSFLAPLGHFKERGVIHVVPAAGGTPQPLADGHAGSFWEVAWLPKEPRLIAAVGEGVRHALAAVDLQGRITHLASMQHSIIPYWEAVWSVDANGRTVAYLSEAEGGREVWVASLDGGEPRRLTHVTTALDEVALGPVEAVQWTNPKDGAAVEGVLVSPPDAGEGRRPLVAWLHGGPAYHWGLGSHVQSWARLLAARGFRVLLPNFRGSSGYGQAWLTANFRDWADGPMGDVMSGVDEMVARGLADPERLYVGGGSYGGYLTYWALGHTTRFRAAYLRAGVSDPASAYALTDEPSFFAGYFGASPYEEPEIYRKLAPLAHVGAVSTPLLIVHGEEDARVPLFQSMLFYAGLRERGATVRLVVYPREGHGIQEYAHQVDHMNRLLDWYAAFEEGRKALQ